MRCMVISNPVIFLFSVLILFLLNFHEALETRNTVLPLIQLESRAGHNSASTVKLLVIEDKKYR